MSPASRNRRQFSSLSRTLPNSAPKPWKAATLYAQSPFPIASSQPEAVRTNDECAAPPAGVWGTPEAAKLRSLCRGSRSEPTSPPLRKKTPPHRRARPYPIVPRRPQPLPFRPQPSSHPRQISPHGWQWALFTACFDGLYQRAQIFLGDICRRGDNKAAFQNDHTVFIESGRLSDIGGNHPRFQLARVYLISAARIA